jgi:hypothetical protein
MKIVYVIYIDIKYSSFREEQIYIHKFTFH